MVLTSRGAAFGDLFNRGQIDIVLNNLDAIPTLLRNVGTSNNWITFKLLGTGKSPADAVGATVWVTANGITQRQDVISGGSFLSSSDMRPHFGLGTATKLEKVEIRWPSGRREAISVAGLNRIVTVVEGKGEVVEGASKANTLSHKPLKR